MRLLVADSIRTRDSETNKPQLKCVEFNPDEIPPYAILSHTWARDEVLLADVVNGTAHERQAWKKVFFACTRALDDNLAYVWVDTCCIDKTSSAELSEAINTMFAWYRQAAVCYAYLGDLYDGVENLADCRWFTRGFTLQELIAPANVEFYAGRNFLPIGDKTSLSKYLEDITRISEEILIGVRPFETASVANRMGWAARRNTTRPEDIAYCLMGIFNVNMPLLYGEGTKAFIRLQEEIMKQTTDHSLFVWQDEDAPDNKEYGLLAPSPRCFDKTYEVVPYQPWETRQPHAITNEGLSIHIPIVRALVSGYIEEQDDHGRKIFHGVLDCPTPDFRNAFFTTIYVVETELDGLHYARVRASRLNRMLREHVVSSGNSGRRQVYILPTPKMRPPEIEMVYPWHFVQLEAAPLSLEYTLLQVDKLGYLGGFFCTLKSYNPKPLQGSFKEWDISRNLGKVPVDRGPSKPILALLLERQKDGRRLVITVGSLDALRLGFCAREIENERTGVFNSLSGYSKMPSPELLREQFKPTLLGKSVTLDHHVVRVTSRNQVEKMSKNYYLAITVTPDTAASAAPPGSVNEGSESSSVRASKEKVVRRLRGMLK